MAGDVVDPAKIFLSSSLVTMQNLVAACRTSWAYVGRSKKLCVNAGLHTLGYGSYLILCRHAPPQHVLP